jgi:glycolate oxidase FAD binding subunit
VTSLRSTVARLFGSMLAEVDGAPEADFIFAPETSDDSARILDFASEHRLIVLPWGGGTHQGMGGRVSPDIVLSTSRLAKIVEWQPDDLTVVAEAGVVVATLEGVLAERGQSAMLPEAPGAGTVGGAVAAGASGWRRLRYGPTRERILEVVIATGDGRVVKGGARVVKNVTGYDIPRLVTGSFGTLGVLTVLCLKLWPAGASPVTVRVDDPDAALRSLHRPLAVIEEDGVSTAYLAGPEAQVEQEVATLGGEPLPGHRWPEPVAGLVVVEVRVPPASIREAVTRLPAPSRYVAGHGVGNVSAAFDDADTAALSSLRAWAEGVGGAVVLVDAPTDVYEELDAWGTPPASLGVQRRIKGAFDPLGVMVPGRMPGGM